MDSIAHISGTPVSTTTARVTPIEAGRATYRTVQGKERPTFTAIPDWLSAYKPRLARGRGWELLDTILHHQRMGQRHQPVAISLAQFAQETGHAIPTVRKALADLARVGLLYAELDTPERRDSGFRYAIQDPPGQGVLEREGRLMISLLDGWYEIDPARVVQRLEGVKETDTLQDAPGVQATDISRDAPGVQAIDIPVCKQRSDRSTKNVRTRVNVTYRPPAPEAKQTGARACTLDITDERDEEKFHFRGTAAPEASDEDGVTAEGDALAQTRQTLNDLQRELRKLERSRTLASGPYHHSLKAQEQTLLEALSIPTTLVASAPEAEMPPQASEAGEPPAPAVHDICSLAISPEQLAHFRQEMECQRECVQAAAARWEACMEERRHCLDTTRRKALIHEVCQSEQQYHQAQRKLARFELAIEALSAGHTVEEAVALAHERIGMTTSQAAHLAATEPSEAEAAAAAPEEPPPPDPLLEGETLRRALFSKLVALFLPGDPPDKNDVDLSRGVFNNAIKQFMVKQLQPLDVEVLQAVYQRVWPKAVCTAPALAKHLPFLVGKAHEMGYHLSLA